MIAYAQKVCRLLRYNLLDQPLKKGQNADLYTLFSEPSGSEVFYMIKNPKMGEEPF